MAKISEMTVGFREVVPRRDNHNMHFDLNVKIVDLNLETEEEFAETYKHWMALVIKNVRRAKVAMLNRENGNG